MFKSVSILKPLIYVVLNKKESLDHLIENAAKFIYFLLE